MDYTVSDHGPWLADRVRMQAYTQALERAVGPESVVLDIGAGTGTFTLMACRLGARRVFAVEPEETIAVARATARANGYEDRVDFFQAMSTRVTLPERATVIVSDLHGALPLFRHSVPSLIDARERHLAPGGVLLPRADLLWAVPVEAADAYCERLGAWDAPPYDLDLAAARALAVNEWWRVDGDPSWLLAEPKLAAELDYQAIASPSMSASLSWAALRAGFLHGYLVWFDVDFGGGIGFSNAPGKPRTVYRQAFFPLERPVEVGRGDRISLRLRAGLGGDDYIWSWETRLADAADRARATFSQSTLFSFPLSKEALRRLAEGATPKPTCDGRAVVFVLARANGERSLGEIADELRASFPDLVGSRDDSLRLVTDIARKYCC